MNGFILPRAPQVREPAPRGPFDHRRGDYVEHPEHGAGYVVEADNRDVIVMFGCVTRGPAALNWAEQPPSSKAVRFDQFTKDLKRVTTTVQQRDEIKDLEWEIGDLDDQICDLEEQRDDLEERLRMLRESGVTFNAKQYLDEYEVLRRVPSFTISEAQ